jgi:hypothetical protein
VAADAPDPGSWAELVCRSAKRSDFVDPAIASVRPGDKQPDTLISLAGRAVRSALGVETAAARAATHDIRRRR